MERKWLGRCLVGKGVQIKVKIEDVDDFNDI